MRNIFYRFVQSLIVLTLAVYLAEKLVSGRLSYYINLRFAPLTLLGILILALMAGLGFMRLYHLSPLSSAKDGKNNKLPTGLVILILLPIVVAILGLSMAVIVSSCALVLIVILARMGEIRTFFSEMKVQPIAIPADALLILAIPLILGIFVPSRPLSTASLNARGLSLAAPSGLGQSTGELSRVDSEKRTVLDWIKLFNYEEDVTPYLGQTAIVSGFVYHDPRLKDGQFMVSRFAVTCCVADAFAIGMAVDWPDSADLPDNTWVSVEGTIDSVSIEEKASPIIHARSVSLIEAPQQPYLYP